MIKIELQHVQQALEYFDIEEKVESIKILTNDQEERKGERAVRIVAAAYTLEGNKYIVKFLNERSYILDVSKLCIHTETIEKQSEFSEVLRREGMFVPRKYKKNGAFCMAWEQDGFPMDVTVEDFLGEPIKNFDVSMFYTYGCLMGKLHKISLEHNCKIDFSIVYQEVLEKRTDYRKIFSGLNVDDELMEMINEVSACHDFQKEEVIELWPDLPRSAVQGDLYSCNNVALVGKEIGFYDFNIAADEVLIGDMLHVWFRTLYDTGNDGQVQNWNVGKCWLDYLRGYKEFRTWTDKEEEAFPKVCSLMNFIYMGRYAADLMRQNRYSEAKIQLERILELSKI